MQLPILQKATVRAGIRRRLRPRFHRDSCFPEVAALERGNKCCFPKVGWRLLVPSKGSNTPGAIEKVEGSCHLEFFIRLATPASAAPATSGKPFKNSGNRCPLGWYS